jgi:hypothetical protein
MRNGIALGVLALLLWVGCDKSEKAKPAAIADDDPVKALTGFADRVCACRDMACAEQARLDFDAANAARAPSTTRPSDADVEAMKTQAGRLGGCLGELAGQN